MNVIIVISSLLDKSQTGINSILSEYVNSVECQRDRYRNISLSLKNEVCSNVLSCIRLALNGVSGGNQSVCRISILIEEMLEWVESLDTLDSTG